MASYTLFLMRVMLLLAAASQSEVIEDSTFMADDATETRTETGDWQLFDTSTPVTAALKTLIGEASTSSSSVDGVTLPDTGGTLPLDDRLDEGRYLMERFYQRYKTTAQVDLVFVLDRSGSVPHKGWHSVIEFVKVGAVRNLS